MTGVFSSHFQREMSTSNLLVDRLLAGVGSYDNEIIVTPENLGMHLNFGTK